MAHSFLALFILLTIGILVLIWRLTVKERDSRASGFGRVFGNEIWNLITMMIIFGTSFLLRYLYDALYIPYIGYGLKQTTFVIITEMTIS